MIHRGRHASAVIESYGTLVMPETTIVEPNVVILIGEKGRCEFGELNSIYPNTTIRVDRGWMRTGRNVSFGPGCQIYEPRAGLDIGDNCLIAGGVMICGVNHQYKTRAVPMREQPSDSKPVILEEDVWLGMGVIVLPGVTIGRGAIISAGSVVSKNVPPFALVRGVPGRVLRERPQ